MRPHIVDEKALRIQILNAAKACIAEGINPTVRNLRAHGVKGHERRLYQLRRSIAESGEIPLKSIGIHAIHDKPETRKRYPRQPSQLKIGTSRTFTQEMVHLYGGRKRLRREFGINPDNLRMACPLDSREDSQR